MATTTITRDLSSMKSFMALRATDVSKEALSQRIEDANNSKDTRRLTELACYDQNTEVLTGLVKREIVPTPVINIIARRITELAKKKPRQYAPVAEAIMENPRLDERTLTILANFENIPIKEKLLQNGLLPKEVRKKVEEDIRESENTYLWLYYLRRTHQSAIQ